MDYVSMKMSIYENYANGKLSRGNARQLIDVLNNNYGNTLVQEMVDAENEFMMNSVNVAYESAGVDALYEASETFGQKVAKIWENFKKWIKGIIDAILGRKNDINKCRLSNNKRELYTNDKLVMLYFNTERSYTHGLCIYEDVNL